MQDITTEFWQLLSEVYIVTMINASGICCRGGRVVNGCVTSTRSTSMKTDLDERDTFNYMKRGKLQGFIFQHN